MRKLFLKKGGKGKKRREKKRKGKVNWGEGVLLFEIHNFKGGDLSPL